VSGPSLNQMTDSSTEDTSQVPRLHYATLNGHRQIVQLLLERGADIHSTDSQFGATPAGWAIEYLREMGGYLAIELDDLAYAIQFRDTRWVERFLKRFPSLRQASDTNGTPFQRLARESGNPEIGWAIRIGGCSIRTARHERVCRI
jgi:ankyrin repeat protein